MNIRNRRLLLLSKIAKFVIVFSICIGTMTFVWDYFVSDHLYLCTDSLPLGFLTPGDWVHGNPITVPAISAPQSMSEPDGILAGWSLAKLWGLWAAMFSLSTAAAYLSSKARWFIP